MLKNERHCQRKCVKVQNCFCRMIHGTSYEILAKEKGWKVCVAVGGMSSRQRMGQEWEIGEKEAGR